MPEDGSNLIPLRAANSPNPFDLRRIGAHPDFWYPLAWSHELKPGKALGRRFASEPIVLYRGAEGRVFALEDRCAHRQVPLHLGVVCGNELKCHYHGWAYDGAGKCVDVPYLGKDRLPNGVKSYPAREVDGLDLRLSGRSVAGRCQRTRATGIRAGAATTRRANSTATWPVTTPSCTKTCST